MVRYHFEQSNWKRAVLLAAALQRADLIPTSRSLGHSVHCAAVQGPTLDLTRFVPIRLLQSLLITVHRCE